MGIHNCCKQSDDEDLQSSYTYGPPFVNIQEGAGLINDELILLNCSVTDKPPRRCQSAFRYLRSLTIEPFVFLLIFSYCLDNCSVTNMFVDKGCRFYFNYSKELCQSLSNHTFEKEIVEKTANNYSMYVDFANVLAAFQMIFISAWSDKYGRKVPLFLCAVAMLVSNVGMILCVVFFESPMYYTVLSQLPTSVFGDVICLITLVNSHACEVSSEDARTLKYASVETAMCIGLCVGGFIGGIVFEYYGYLYVYTISISAKLLAVMWLLVFVKETIGLESTATCKDKIKDFYVIKSLVANWRATIRPRENNGRFYLWLYLLAVAVLVNSYDVGDYTEFLFVHHLYNWDQGKFTIVTTIFNSVALVIFATITPVMIQVFGVSNSALGLTGVVSMIAKYMVIAFAQSKMLYIYCIGNLVGSFGILVSLSIKSEISRIAEKDEKSLVFSFFAVSEVMTPILGKALNSQVYNATMNIYPSITYLVMVVTLFIPLGIFMYAYIDFKKRRRGDDTTVKS